MLKFHFQDRKPALLPAVTLHDGILHLRKSKVLAGLNALSPVNATDFSNYSVRPSWETEITGTREVTEIEISQSTDNLAVGRLV